MASVSDIYREEFRDRIVGGRPRSLLEVGSGDGGFLKTVVRDVPRLCGLDPDPENVAALKSQGFEAVLGSADRLPFADGEFDVVAFSFTPHHLADWDKALNEAFRVARHSVEILDVWYDDTVPDQRTAHALDRWLKTVDRRTGMTHMDTLPPGAMLAPVLARRDVTYDYICRRVAEPANIDETLELGSQYLARVGNDAELTREFDKIVADARRDGMTDEGAILLTIEKRR